MHSLRQRPFLALLLLTLILAFTFMGSRSLWEPDEGRYTNVALNIVDSGEWISLYRHPASLHFTKPPLTYWMIAASVNTFGFNTWAVRFPIALAYIFSVLLIYQLGKPFCREKPWLPALIFATSPLPFLAGNYISTDFVLAACETLAVLCFMQYAFLKKLRFWIDAMWASFGLAFLAKGPPGLLPLIPIIIFLWRQKDLSSLIRPLGFAVFVVIGLSWYIVVIQRHPGLLDYFIGHEVVARLTDARMQRNPEWYAPFKIYLPSFVLGSLPWIIFSVITAFILRLKASTPTVKATREEQLEQGFFWLWLLLPLLVFCLSRSRMPLYVLPLFTPLAFLLARSLRQFQFKRYWLSALFIWLILLLGTRYATSQFNHYKAPDVFAEKLLALTKSAPQEIIFVEDTTRYGLHLYLGSKINKVSFKPQPKNISDSSFDMTLSQALTQAQGKRIFVLKHENEQYFLNALSDKKITGIFLGAINDARNRKDQERLIYTIANEFEHIKKPSQINQAPVARSNWALATANTSRGHELFAFYGLGPKKTYDDIQKDVYVFNQTLNSWDKVADIPVKQGVLASVAASLDNKIYLAGGYTVAKNGDEKSTPDVLQFDPEAYQFKHISELPTPVDDSVMLAWRHRYLVFISGWHNTGNVKAVQIFDTAKNNWIQATQWPGDAVFGHSGGIVGDSMIICDGVTAIRGNDGKNKFALTDKCYRGDLNADNPAKIRWLAIANHPGAPVYRAAAIGTEQLGARIVFAGGANHAYNYNGIGYDGVPVAASDKVFSYDLNTQAWQEHSPLSAPSMDHRGLIEMNGEFYLPGGMRDPQIVTNKGLVFSLK
jgi:4-amino-4-deoxy-L-arabinose transferase-like glycosyltransferase/N-acetylneuraminic acid mutarotase